VIDLDEEKFPNKRLMFDIEEERRLFYVAVTRAKKEIILTCSETKRNGKKQGCSVFLKEGFEYMN